MGVLSSCIYRLSSDILPYSDTIMAMTFKIFDMYFTHEGKSHPPIFSTVVEDGCLLVSALINALGAPFSHAYIAPLLNPYLPLLLRSHNNPHDRLCLLAVGIVSDMVSANANTEIGNDDTRNKVIMKLLLDVLQNTDVHGDVKPATISCIGDMAYAMGPLFMPYVETVMMMLQQVGNLQTDPHHQTAEEQAYVDTLRVSSIDAFVGMLQGLSGDETTKQAFEMKVADFMLYVDSVSKDVLRSDRLDGAILGLLGYVSFFFFFLA